MWDAWEPAPLLTEKRLHEQSPPPVLGMDLAMDVVNAAEATGYFRPQEA